MMTNVCVRAVLLLSLLAVGATARAAAPVGNPARTLGQGHFAAGIEGSMSTLALATDGIPTIQTTYQGNTVTTPLALQTRDLEGEYQELMVRVQYGVLSWLDVWAKGGAAKIKQSCSKWNQATVVGYYGAESEWGPAWAVGAKARLYHSDGGLSLGVLGQFSQYFNDKFDLSVEAAGSNFKPAPIDAGLFPVVTTPITHFSIESTTRVYQVAVGLNQKLDAFNVYGGGQLSLMKNTYTNDVWGYGDEGLERRKEKDNKLMSARRLGLFMGLEYTLYDHLTLGLEARFYNEVGVSSAITYER